MAAASLWHVGALHGGANPRRGRCLRLDGRYICIAYAAFMPEQIYESLRNEMPIWLSQEEARGLFRRFSPSNVSAPLGETVPSLGHYVPSDSGHGP
jgi:hypothetical protein